MTGAAGPTGAADVAGGPDPAGAGGRTVYAVRSARVLFGDTVALDDVTVEVVPGSVVAVVGGDGAGKSTLLRALVGEVALASGTVVAPPADRIGYMPASAGSWSALTVGQNVDFVAGIYGVRGEELVKRRSKILRRAGLTFAQDRLASQLSGGMRRKLGFSMAMVHEPPLLVLDEPSTGIDPVSRIDLWRLVTEAAASGAAVLMSTSYLDEAERAAHLLVLDAGRTLAEGTPEDVLASLPGRVSAPAAPRRPEWAWRRGRAFHEYWPPDPPDPPDPATPPNPPGDEPLPDGRSPRGGGAPPVEPDLEDVVIALSLLRRHAETVSR